MTTFMIGADPEVFVAQRGKLISAHGMIPGTKKEPFKVDNGAVQVDGMALEFNIDPVRLVNGGGEEFNRNIVSVMATLKKMAGDKVNLKIQPVAEFDPAYIAAQPDEAKELGCDPDYNAYTLKPNPRPDGELPFRTASGHIHVGWGADIPVDHPDHMEICADFIKALDIFVGLPLKILDKDDKRRELYGKAGAFRPKPYGVEYRTPSNYWLTSKKLRMAVFEAVQKCVTYMQSEGSSEAINKRFLGIDVQAAIDTGDRASFARTAQVFASYTGCYTFETLLIAANKKGF